MEILIAGQFKKKNQQEIFHSIAHPFVNFRAGGVASFDIITVINSHPADNERSGYRKSRWPIKLLLGSFMNVRTIARMKVKARKRRVDKGQRNYERNLRHQFFFPLLDVFLYIALFVFTF